MKHTKKNTMNILYDFFLFCCIFFYNKLFTYKKLKHTQKNVKVFDLTPNERFGGDEQNHIYDKDTATLT